jgi:hypothetical protein
MVASGSGHFDSQEDFADLALPVSNVRALRTCRPGNCGVKLAQHAFDLIAQVDWRAAAATAQVTTLARNAALDYLDGRCHRCHRTCAASSGTATPSWYGTTRTV